MSRQGIVNLTRFWQTGVMKIQPPSYQRHRFPSEIISYAVWLYHRFCLSFRGDTIDLLVQRRRNQRAAERFFRRLLKGQGGEPRWLMTDKLRSYDAYAGTPQSCLCE